jgi:hypothetical protein
MRGQMASLNTTAPKLFARDIVAYSDAELDQYLEQSRRLALYLLPHLTFCQFLSCYLAEQQDQNRPNCRTRRNRQNRPNHPS